MDFTVNGQPASITRADLYAGLRGKRPRVVGQQRYLIKVRKQMWPAKQALETALAAHGWHSERPIPTPEALRVLEALGWEIIRKEGR